MNQEVPASVQRRPKTRQNHLSTVVSWWTTAFRNPEHLLLHPDFLEDALATYPTVLMGFVWDCLRGLRLLAALGISFRFWSHRQDYTSLSLQVLVIISVVGFIFTAIRGIIHPFGEFDPDDTTRLRTWMHAQAIVEVVCITAIHTLSMQTTSDLYLLYIIPLTGSIAYLSNPNVVMILILVLSAMAVSTFGANGLTVEQQRTPLAVLTNVYSIRAIIVVVGTALTAILHRYLNAQRAVWAAVMEAMPEGLAIVDKKGRKIQWVNAAMRQFCLGERELVGDVCFHAYKRAEVPCSPCPSEAAFRGQKNECVTRSPEYIHCRSDGREVVPSENEWRRFDTCCAPIKHRGQVIAALECAKDSTGREVLREATFQLQGATTVGTVLATLGNAISSLGYKRHRIYLMSPDKNYFVGAQAQGLLEDRFVGWRLPRLGEPFSKTTCNSNRPVVYRAPEGDPYRDFLQKDPALPWIEVPLRAGTELYGKISIDNKGHPFPERASLQRELVASNTGMVDDNLSTLHNLSVQAALVIGRLQVQQQTVTLLTSYIHSSLGLFTLVPTYAYILSYSTDKSERDDALRSIYGTTRVLSAYGKTIWKWAEMLCELTPTVNLEGGQVDVAQVLRDITTWFEPVVRGLHCTIEVSSDSVLAAVDRQFVEQIVFTLLSNAVRAALKKHGHNGNATVTMSCKKIEHNRIAVCISDNGAGVPPSQAKVLFDNVVRSTHGRGMGVGLFVANNLATIHKGTVRLVENHQGDGATFRVELQELEQDR